jgi:hypothetical protein
MQKQQFPIESIIAEIGEYYASMNRRTVFVLDQIDLFYDLIF